MGVGSRSRCSGLAGTEEITDNGLEAGVTTIPHPLCNKKTAGDFGGPRGRDRRKPQCDGKLEVLTRQVQSGTLTGLRKSRAKPIPIGYIDDFKVQF
jgi:hypothetical protein